MARQEAHHFDAGLGKGLGATQRFAGRRTVDATHDKAFAVQQTGYGARDGQLFVFGKKRLFVPMRFNDVAAQRRVYPMCDVGGNGFMVNPVGAVKIIGIVTMGSVGMGMVCSVRYRDGSTGALRSAGPRRRKSGNQLNVGRLFDKIDDTGRALGACSDGLLHGGKLSFEDARTGQVFRVADQGAGEGPPGIEAAFDKAIKRRVDAGLLGPIRRGNRLSAAHKP